MVIWLFSTGPTNWPQPHSGLLLIDTAQDCSYPNIFFFCLIPPLCCVNLCRVKHLHISELYNRSAPSSIIIHCAGLWQKSRACWESMGNCSNLSVPILLDCYRGKEQTSSWNCKCVPDDRPTHLSTALMKHCSPTPLLLWAENNHMCCFVFPANTSATRPSHFNEVVYIRAHLSSFLCNQSKPTPLSF